MENLVSVENFDKIEFLSDCKKFYDILLDESLLVEDVLPINDDIVQIKYKRRVEEKMADFNVNVLMALFTTSNARICLYRALEKIEERMRCTVTQVVVLFYTKDAFFLFFHE